MKKLLKVGKSFTAYAIALAVLAVSLFTGMVFTADAATGSCGRSVVELWDGKDENGAWIGWTYNTFSGGTGTKDDPYIIKYSEQMAYLATAGASTYDTTVGKYYKVDDSIKAFNMNSTGIDLSGSMTATEVKTALENEVVNRTYWAAAVFAGSFDGNGVEIYGLHAGDVNYSGGGTASGQVAALFPVVAPGATIKNVKLKNSYFSTTTDGCGGIIGRVNAVGSADTVYVENCIVHNCYFSGTNATYAPGVIAGKVETVAYIDINNALVYKNEVSSPKSSIPTIVGVASKAAGGTTLNRVKNSVILDATPYDANGSWWFKACDHGIFQNVYFDQTASTSSFGNYGNSASKLTQLNSAADAIGVAAATNLSGLSSEDWFFNTTTYPQQRVFHDIVLFDNNDGTHNEQCDCGLKSSPVPHEFKDGVCECGSVAKCGGVISVYSGTPDTSLSGSGTIDDPYLVTSADEFAAVALGKIASTEDTYFKVDGVDAFYKSL